MRLSAQKLFGLLGRMFREGSPYHAQWFLTRRCNYRCRTCSVWREQQEENVRELETSQVKRGLDVLKRLGVIEIVLSGGNPLLREDIDEIIEYASRFFITTVYDNGSIAARKVDALRNADFVAISLDSLDEKRNDYLRGVNGAWKKAMNSIKTLKKEGITVGVAPTISQANMHEMIDFTNYFIKRGIPVWYATYSYDSPSQKRLFGIGKRSEEFEILDGRKMAELCDALLKMKRKHKGIFMTDKTLVSLRQLFAEGHRTWRCKALESFLMIDHLGRVAGCHYYEPVTSIFDLLEMWNSEKFESLRNFYSRCSRCTYVCYMFYSLYSNVLGNLEIMFDQAKNTMLLA
ncbi:MAG: radical SAM protein [Candidatus Bathyarchaeia archaeon]